MKTSVDYVVLTLQYTRDDKEDVWLGSCMETAGCTYAETLDECQTKMTELMVDYFAGLEEIGELEASLKRWGVKVYSADPADTAPGIPDALASAVNNLDVFELPWRAWLAAAFQSCNWPLFQPCIVPIANAASTVATAQCE